MLEQRQWCETSSFEWHFGNLWGKNASCDSHNKISYSNLRGVESRFLSVDSPTSWGRMPKRFDRDLRKAGMKVILLENRNREQ